MREPSGVGRVITSRLRPRRFNRESTPGFDKSHATWIRRRFDPSYGGRAAAFSGGSRRRQRYTAQGRSRHPRFAYPEVRPRPLGSGYSGASRDAGKRAGIRVARVPGITLYESTISTGARFGLESNPESGIVRPDATPTTPRRTVSALRWQHVRVQIRPARLQHHLDRMRRHDLGAGATPSATPQTFRLDHRA